MDLNSLVNLVGKSIIISRVQIYTDNTKVVECVQGILKEIRAGSIIIEQCFINQDYLEKTTHATREFTNNAFVLLAPVRS